MLADGTEWDGTFAYAFYFCKDCNRTLMLSHRVDTVTDKEERI